MPITRDYPQYNDPLVIIWRKGTTDDPYTPITETRKIINNITPLKEIPDDFNHVIVSGYTEIYSGTPTPTQFIVNYQAGFVTFNSSENGKTLTFTYKGKGVILYPAERIYSHSDNPDVVTSMQDIIDSGNEAIQALGQLNETIDHANAATSAANTAATNANTKGAYAQTQGDYAKGQGDYAKSQGDYAKSSGDALSYKGDYSSTTAYVPKNIIFYNGIVYMNIVASTNVLPTVTANWRKLGYLSWRDVYSTSTTYSTGDFVSDSNNYNIYVSVKDSNTNQLLTNTTYWAKLISVQTVVDNANTATTQANAARDAANTAASAANIAKTNADTATTNANTATTQANAARDAANTATTQANTARDAANTAANNAQAKADGLISKGTYDPAVSYVRNNIVEYQGYGWINVTPCTGIPPTNSLYWKMVVARGEQGFQGIQGDKGDKGDKGDSFVWQGDYSNSLTYNPRDVVSYQGSSYICIVQTTGSLPTNTSFWNIVAKKGIDGAGTVTSVSAGTSDVIIGGTPDFPTIALNVGTGANQIVKRDGSGNIAGNITGNASTVTTNANLTGVITSVGNVTSLSSGIQALIDSKAPLDGSVPFRNIGISPATSSGSAGIWFADSDNVNQGVVYWDKTSDQMIIAHMNVDGSAVDGQFGISATQITFNGSPILTQSATNWGVTQISGTPAIDCNNVFKTGIYHAGSSALNKPTAQNGALLVYGAADTAGQYTAQQFHEWGTGNIYTRTMSAGVWKEWVLSVAANNGRVTFTSDVTAPYFNAVGSGVINIDNTSSGFPDMYFKSNGANRGRIFFDTGSTQFAVRAYDTSGTNWNQITLKALDGVTPAAVMNFQANLNYPSGANKAAIDLNNSDIINANAIWMADDANAVSEGILWAKTGTTKGSTTQSDYINMRVDGAGIGFIGTDQIITTGAALSNRSHLNFDISTGERDIQFVNGTVGNTSTRVFGIAGKIGTSNMVGGTLGLYDWAQNHYALRYLQNADGTTGKLSTQNNTLDDGAGNMVAAGGLTISDNIIVKGGAGSYKGTSYRNASNTELLRMLFSESTGLLYVQNPATGNNLLAMSPSGDTVKTVKNTLDDGSGNITVNGVINVNGNSKTLSIGTGSSDVYVTNGKGQYIQMRDTGDLWYSGNTLMNTSGDFVCRGTVMAPTRVTSGVMEFWNGGGWQSVGAPRTPRKTTATAANNTALSTMLNITSGGGRLVYFTYSPNGTLSTNRVQVIMDGQTIFDETNTGNVINGGWYNGVTIYNVPIEFDMEFKTSCVIKTNNSASCTFLYELT